MYVLLMSETESKEANIPDWANRIINSCPVVKLYEHNWWRDVSGCSDTFTSFLVNKLDLFVDLG